jgi:phosphoribosylformimino-5-aminoimidazole carboxamide ribotide isomerase
MILIPVIDLMHARVVRAIRGDRGSYQPIVSKLCAGSDPVTLARTLAGHCAARQIYIADLDALTGGAAQADVLRDIVIALPGLELWVDAGFASAQAADELIDRIGVDGGVGGRRIVPIFASESLRSPDELARCFERSGEGILSLDRRDGKKLDAAGCWESPQHWPERVIVMTLERVGADAGPDLATLNEVQARSPRTKLIGAGGIRNPADLSLAEAAGAHAWLVASALHDGRLPRVV